MSMFSFISKKKNTTKTRRIIFLNPLGSNYIYWMKIIDIYPEFNSYELVFIDYSGYGKNPYYNWPNPQELALCISKEILSLKKKETHIIALSYGGLIARYLSCLLNPIKIILISVVPYLRKEELIRLKKMKILLQLEKLYDFVLELKSLCYSHRDQEENPFIHILLFASLKKNTSLKTLLNQVEHIQKNTDNYYLVEAETLIIYGEEDPSFPRDILTRYDSVFNNYTILRINKRGHFFLENNTLLLKKIFTFLSK